MMSQSKPQAEPSRSEDPSGLCPATPEAILSMDVWVSRRKRVHVIESLDGKHMFARTYLQDVLNDAFEAGLTRIGIEGMTGRYHITLVDLNTS